MSMQEFK